MAGHYDPQRHHRRSIRLRGYDYTSPGAYFVTICAYGRECLFGEVADGEVVLSEYGAIIEQVWHDLPLHYPHVRLDTWVIMPNHVHGIIILVGESDAVGAGLGPAPTAAPTAMKRHGLPEIVRALKSFSARRINELRGVSGVPVWQRNYWEHVIRSERTLHLIQQYILDNPACWHLDRYHPAPAIRDPDAQDLSCRPEEEAQNA